MDQLASYINTQNLGVTASVVNDASGSRLALVSNSSGSANNVTVSNLTGGIPAGSSSAISFTQITGEDASLTVDGIPIDSASNTVTGAVDGLTLNLQSQSPTQVNISVAQATSAVSTAVNSFVSAYNTVVGDINAQYTVNPSSHDEGPLATDSNLSMLQTDLLGSPSYSAGSGSISTLADLGITMNNDGTLTVDSTTLNNAIQNNFSGVQNFLQGSSLNGFAATLNNQLDSFTNSTSGAFTLDLQSISTENTYLGTQITNFQTYLQTQQTLLTTEYTQADINMQELPEQMQEIDTELGLNNTNSSTTGA
jgi:flagellar hook-associated protein 2